MGGELDMTSDTIALKEAIIERIEREGAITFRDYMEMALYHPRLGYYCSPGEKIGHAGDYLTSPELSPIFGALLGRQLHEMWESMGRPARFQIVEAGAGNGKLCVDLLLWSKQFRPDFFASVQYTVVEISAASLARQRVAVEGAGLGNVIHWSEALLDAMEGCVLSNELLDAMPVHRVAIEGARLHEIFVTWNGSEFNEELRDPSTPELEAYFDRLGLLPGEGGTAEVNLDAFRWMRQAADALQRGFILTLDYGYEAEELYAPWRTDGTLLCFYRHNPSANPYVRIGRQDMSSHVDFTSLKRAAEEEGAHTLGLVSQSDFLTNLGITEALEPSESNLESHHARRRAMLELLDPAELGRIKVLAQSKGVRSKLCGFSAVAN